MRITAPLQWVDRPGEQAGFHLRLDTGVGNSLTNESTDNLEVRIPSEDVLEALESIRRVHSGEDDSRHSDFRIRHRLYRR